MKSCKRLGIDIGSTTVKVAIIDDSGSILFADYERHFANIQETLALLLKRAVEALGEMELYPVITGLRRTYAFLPPGGSVCSGGRSSRILASRLCAADGRGH